jgi:peptide/nickel transport system substrate-binding protein
VALSAPPATLDPCSATDATGSRIVNLVYSSLVRIGDDLKITGDAAESWSAKPNAIEFRLRPRIRFSNGAELTRDDLLFSFDQARRAGSPIASGLRTIETVTVNSSSPFTVRLTLKQPTATLLTNLAAVKILQRREFTQSSGSMNLEPNSSITYLSGTGPFVIVSANANEIILRARHDHSWAAPHVDNVVFKIIRDDQTRTLKVQNNEIDLAQQELPPIKVHELQRFSSEAPPERRQLQIFHKHGLALTYLLVNLRDSTLKQVNVRRAIAQAIDRASIIHNVLNDLALPATSLVSPATAFFDNALKPIVYDFTSARSEIGSVSNLKNVKLVLKSSDNAAATDNARIIAHDLRALGLNVRCESREWGSFYSDVQNGRFQLALMRWVGTVDPDLYRLAFHSQSLPPQGRNRGFYANAEVDRLTTLGANAIDDVRRHDIYNKVQRIVFEDLPIIPLWYDDEVAVVNRRVRDYELPLSGEYTILTKLRLE